jgi:predicted nucleic acid-binding protein
LFEIRDAKDYMVLHTAIIADVDIFITWDKDFKDIDIESPEIMTAKEFLEKYWVHIVYQ